jgi:hypothetical protein
MVAGGPAIAKDLVPYVGSLQMVVTDVTYNDDGSMDQIIEGTGKATHLGAMTIWLSIHVEAGYYDAGMNAWVAPLYGEAVETAANGDTLCLSVDGREIVPFDMNGVPIFPLPLEASLEVTGGTGRFENATGTLSFAGFDQDYIWGAVTGEISSVGTNKR